jgi:putative transposase
LLHIGSASLDASRKVPCGLPDEARLTEDITALAEEFGRYGYRMITGLLTNSGWHVNHMA